MVARIASAIAVSMVTVATTAVDAGAGVSKLQVYSGARPTNLTDAIGAQVKLLEYDFPDPGFGPATAVSTGGQADSNLTGATAPGIVTGVASWFRVIDGNGDPIMDGTVSLPENSGDVKISSVNVTSGIDVQVVSFTFTVPKG